MEKFLSSCFYELHKMIFPDVDFYDYRDYISYLKKILLPS